MEQGVIKQAAPVPMTHTSRQAWIDNQNLQNKIRDILNRFSSDVKSEMDRQQPPPGIQPVSGVQGKWFFRRPAPDAPFLDSTIDPKLQGRTTTRKTAILTYTDSMQKYAKTPYAELAERRDAGDAEVVNALNTSTPAELGWKALGAGLGAGGGYLVSRWLRRNGTKKQRMLDMLIGALIGGGGAHIALNSGTDNSGLTRAEKLRADVYRESKGQTGPGDVDPRAKAYTGKDMFMDAYGALTRGVGALVGVKVGDAVIPLDTALANAHTHRLALKNGITKAEMGQYMSTPHTQIYKRVTGPNGQGTVNIMGGEGAWAGNSTGKVLHGIGSTVNKAIGGVGGYFAGGYIGDRTGNWVYDLVHGDEADKGRA